MFHKIGIAIRSLIKTVIVQLQEEFTTIKVSYYRRQGFDIHKTVYIASNVNLKGKIKIGEGSSLAQNCCLSGGNEGIEIGNDVMIAPNVIIIAFSHGVAKNGVPMSKQIDLEAKVIIEDDVWIASNCTIAKGVRIGKGAVIGANSFVNKDVEPYCIYGGVPAKFIKERA